MEVWNYYDMDLVRFIEDLKEIGFQSTDDKLFEFAINDELLISIITRLPYSLSSIIIENYIPGFSNWEIQLPSILIQHTEKGYALRVSLSGKYLTPFIKNEKIYKRQEDVYKNEENFNYNVRYSVCIHCMQHQSAG